MRILASNPDTIGDMVLRQPLYRALIAHGHELTLIVRKSVKDIASLIAPEAKLLILPAEVYGPVDEQWEIFESIVAEARASEPDLLLIAPFQWTRFEERLAGALRDLPGFQVAGMTGRLYGGDPFAGASRRSELTFDRTLAVDEDVPEADKNALLADMLGCPVSSVEPVVTPDETSNAAAAAILAERGLSPGGYWIACVTGTANVPIKAWPPDQWAQVLRQWHERYGRRFLFVGLPAERSVVELVLAGMGDATAGSAVWMEPDGSVNTLAALAAASQGYVGHDTGPMHIAAAVGKPVLAIFGGGHKLRFVPRVTPSVVLSVRVPCAGCGWACSFEKAHCVHSLRPVDVLRAVEDLEVGRIVGQDVRLLPLPLDVHDAMTAFAADLSRERLRLLTSVQRQLDAVDPHAIIKLTLERDDKAHNAEELSRQLSVVSMEVRRLQDATQNLQEQSAELSRQLQEREQAVGELRQAIEEANQRTSIEAGARKAEVEPLRKEVEHLRNKLSAIESATPVVAGARARRTWRELFVDIMCGKRHYEPKRVQRPMPKICLVTIVRAGDKTKDVRRTIDSVMAERYPHLEYVLVLPVNRDPKGCAETREDTTVNTPVSERTRKDADAADSINATTGNPGLQSTPDTGVAISSAEDEAAAPCDVQSLTNDYTDRVTRIVPPGETPFAAVAEAMANTDADIVVWLDVGLAYEPGALHRAGEYFRDHSMAMAAVFEETTSLNSGGWRFTGGWPGVNVQSLRDNPSVTGLPHVCFRREPYGLLGQINPALGEAAGWDMLIRFSRRFGIRRVKGHGVYRFGAPSASELQHIHLDEAQKAFDATYGVSGKARSLALAIASGLFDTTRLLLKRDGWRWPAWLVSGGGVAAMEPPLATAANPVNRRRPDRLLFSSRDVTTQRPEVYRVYREATGDAAIAFPPISIDALQAHCAERLEMTGSAVVPQAARVMGTGDSLPSSPFQRFRNGPIWPRFVASLPSPYWRLAGAKSRSESAVDHLLSMVGSTLGQESNVRALVVGTQDLDALKAQTKWTLTGLEPNPAAADAAEAEGHRVFRCNPQDAFMTLPDGEVFDLIFVPSMLEHWDDPAWVLRRLVRMLTPTGRIVVRTPNLDSMLLRRYGPTWWHWQVPYHRILFGRRGLRLLAAAVDMKVERLKTVTDAYAAAASVQLNEIGLAGIVPEGAVFEKRIARRGAKWAGWARTLWDRWGRGDEMWAVFRPM